MARRWNVRKIVWFVVLAFGFSWAWWIPMALAGSVSQAGSGWPTHLPGLLGPALAAIVVTGVSEGKPGLADLWLRITRWRVAWVWYAITACTVAMMLIPLVTAAVTSEPVAAADFATYSGAPATSLLVLVPYVLVVNGFGEEIGWRGFLADRLLRRCSRVVTAVLVWAVWALWHLPLFWVVGNFRDFSPATTTGWLVGLLCGSLWLTWMYASADCSILVVAMWHTAYNFTTATDATSGLAAAVSSTLVMVASVAVALQRSSWASPREGVPA